jgi:hypothetical protein
MPANNAAMPSMSPAQQNALARQLILANAVDRFQQISTTTVSASSVGGLINVQPRNVGLIRGFVVDVIASVANSAGGAATLTKWGAANILSGITLTDLQNNTRIQTTGWHLHAINTARTGKPFGIGFAIPANPPVGYGTSWGEVSAPATLAASATGTVTMRYYVPVCYGPTDLRGAIFASVVNATMSLGLQINQNAFVASGDDTLGVYSGSAGLAGTLSGIGNVTVNVYQHYYDQIPESNGQPVLPMQDLSTVYELKATSVSGLSEGLDFPISYANFRTFMSTCAIFDNGGTLNTGSDVNYWELQSANFTNIWKMSPAEAALFSLMKNGTDWPAGMYYFDHRQRPINTSQFGNMQLILNPATVNAGAQILLGYEDFAITNVMNAAASLPGG